MSVRQHDAVLQSANDTDLPGGQEPWYVWFVARRDNDDWFVIARSGAERVVYVGPMDAALPVETVVNDRNPHKLTVTIFDPRSMYVDLLAAWPESGERAKAYTQDGAYPLTRFEPSGFEFQVSPGGALRISSPTARLSMSAARLLAPMVGRLTHEIDFKRQDLRVEECMGRRSWSYLADILEHFWHLQDEPEAGDELEVPLYLANQVEALVQQAHDAFAESRDSVRMAMTRSCLYGCYRTSLELLKHIWFTEQRLDG